MGDSDCEVSLRPYPELAQCHFCCSLLGKASTDSTSTYAPRACPESQWPCDSAAITGFLPVPLTIPVCCTARPSLYSSAPVHSRHLCRRSLPRLFPWAFSLTTQVPVQVSLFMGLPEHGSRPSLTTFVCWVPISHLRPTTRTQTLSGNLWCIPSTTVGHLQPSTRGGYIMVFKFLLNKK